MEFYCSQCRARLQLTRSDGEPEDRGPDGRGAMDESFLMVDDAKRHNPATQLRSLEDSFVDLGTTSLLKPAPLPGPSRRGSMSSGPSRTTLPTIPAAGSPRAPGAPTPSSTGGNASSGGAGSLGGAAGASAAAAGGGGGGGAEGGRATSDSTLDAKLQLTADLLELASTATGVDHPLCLDCSAQLKEAVTGQIAEVEREIAAYSAAAAKLAREQQEPLSEEAFAAELARLKEVEEAAAARAADLEAQIADSARHSASLEAAAAEVAALEARYWHAANDYQLQLSWHMGERDALLSKIDRSTQQLQLLKATNVLNDAFKIWHEGPFGTISGFRLGRTPEVVVGWEEINAAWGQAVLLLHTLAAQCQLNFSGYRLLPMGSAPRIADGRATYDLYGPVSKLWSSSYDRAMVGFLACLREAGEYARARDMAENRLEPFELPFAIEGDRVGSYTIKYSALANKDAKWTKALKLMLADLKMLQQWSIKREAAGGYRALPALGAEGPLPPGQTAG